MSDQLKIGSKIPCLDGLRAFAISLVLLSHVIHTGVPSWLQKVIGYGSLGTIGVRLFFVLSGFLITHILIGELRQSGKINFKKFFIRRILRIFPCFYFFLITLGFLSFIDVVSIDLYAILFSFLYIQNLNVFQNTEMFATSWLVKHSWSLSVEEQFYIIYPFLLRKISLAFSDRPVYIMFLVTMVCTFFRALNYSFPEISRITGGVFFMHADFLFYGGSVALLLSKKQEELKEKIYSFRYWLLVLALIIAVYSSRVEYYSVLSIIVFGNLILLSVVYILLFFLLFPSSRLGRIFEYPVIKSIGILSYSLYVWQQLFLGSTNYWIKYKFVTLFPYNILLVFTCAICSYLFIEKPFLRLKKNYSA